MIVEKLKNSWEYIEPRPIISFGFNATKEVIGRPGEICTIFLKRKDIRRIGAVNGLVVCPMGVQCKVVSLISRPHAHYIEIIPFRFNEPVAIKKTDELTYINSTIPVLIISKDK